MPITALIILLFSCILLWFGAGLVISAVQRFSHKLGMSSFTVSFVILGLLTSLPEMAVGLQSVTINRPEIFMGNLLGGIIGLFLLVIPLLAVLGNGIVIRHQFTGKFDELFALVVIGAPAFLFLDGGLTQIEAMLLIIAYCALVVKTWQKNSSMQKVQSKLTHRPKFQMKDAIKILFGIVLIAVASNLAVKELLELSVTLRMSTFVISVLALSFGTNLPELSLAIRSVFSKNKQDVAFGDYLGSAAANTILFGVFTIAHGAQLSANSIYAKTSLFIALSLVLFYMFSRSGRKISRNEGLLMLATYGLFLYTELQ